MRILLMLQKREDTLERIHFIGLITLCINFSGVKLENL